ncbi:MAG: DUF1361 domain-containing protein [bacterium]
MQSFIKTFITHSFFPLFLLTFFGITLLLIRVTITHSSWYSFLLWNLLLAWVPYVCSSSMIALRKAKHTHIYLFLLGITWFLFFPNAPYIITDFVHLKERTMPIWFDIVLLSSFALNGLFLGFISLRSIEEIVQEYVSTWVVKCMVVFILLSSSFGIYIGRFHRWNSWNVINKPTDLLFDILATLLHPITNAEAYAVTLVFFFFLTITYMIFISLHQHRHKEPHP